ncbi:MAG: 4Fe-4S dicluster domain-containing protein [Clostridiales bacterium]|nr:4Fe-4S dicluster domain-containing protein [Clostridiales bacterium]
MGENRSYGKSVAQTPPDYSFCAGCMSCEIICALGHDGVAGPTRRRLTVQRDIRKMTHTVLTCMQCSDHPCLDACPKKGEAMAIDENGVVYINEDECIGCGLCAKACVFEPSRITFYKNQPKDVRKARKCDMCRTREEGPACVQWCPVRCLYVTAGEERPREMTGGAL